MSEKMKIHELLWADIVSGKFEYYPYPGKENEAVPTGITNVPATMLTGDWLGTPALAPVISELEKNRKTIDALAEQLGVPVRIFKGQEQHYIDEGKYKLHPTDEVDEPVIVKTEVTRG